MSRLRRPRFVAAFLLVLALVAGVAAGAAPKAKLKVTSPVSAVAGQPATFAIAVTSKDKKALKGLKLELVLSADAKRDAKDIALGKAAALSTIKAKKTVKKRVTARIPATVPSGVFRVIACLKAPKAKKKDKVVCASAPLAVKVAGSTPAPKPGGTTPPAAPAPVTPAPTAAPTAAPTTTPSPTPEPTPTPEDTTPPAPGPKDTPPADPADVAPTVAADEATSVAEATSFLYEGANPIQKDVAAGTIKEKRVAVLRGRVTTRVESGISGVRVTVADHDEYGRTATRDDGTFDIAVNGGGPLTLVFEREGYIPVQRLVEVPWQDYADVDAVVMVPYDGKETDVDTSGAEPYQVAKGTTVGTGDDARTATLLFEKGTGATMELPNGTTKPVTDLDVRMTEYTQGATGRGAMPGQLPPNTAYTYAAEFSVDQAVSNGATDVKFDKPVVSYTDNFIDLPVGTAVPTGYYDREREEWVGAKNGIVIQIVGETGGAADVSIDGDPEAEPAGELAAIGMDLAERQRLASLYDAPKQLWRVEITHFTPWDYNMPYGPDGDAGGPSTGGPSGGPGDGGPGDCGHPGSIILCDSQVLGESLPITGSGFDLVYRSDRVPGRIAERTVDIPLTDGAPPASASFVGIDLEIDVAGRPFRQSFPKAAVTANMVHRFTWDGLDAYGRQLQGAQPAKIRVGYTYKAVYQAPGAQFDQAWSRLSGQPMTGNRARQEYTIWQEDATKLGTIDTRGEGLGGWTLSIHHAYDPVSRTLVMGDGSQRDAEPERLTVLDGYAGLGYSTFYGDGGPAKDAYLGAPRGVAVLPDGRVVIADTDNNRIRRVATDGTIATIAGDGEYGASGDGSAATSARLSAPRGIAADENGAVYIADTGANRVRRIGTDGKITTVAGGGHPADGLGDNGPAGEARLSGPTAVAVAADGAVYIADAFHHRVRMVGTDGLITTVAGTGSPGFTGDGGPASAAALRQPQGLAVDPDGQLLIADTGNHRIRRVGVDGVIATIAGGSAPADDLGDGGLATAARLSSPTSLAIAPDAGILVADAGHARIRRLETDGTIRTVVGGAAQDPGADGYPATAARLQDPTGIAVAPDGKVYVAERGASRVRRAALLMKGFADGDQLIASEDGTEIYQFNSAGRHERTLDALTNGVKAEFQYGADGKLTGVSDPQGTLLTIQRTGGAPTKLIARGGAETKLATDAGGYLTSVTNPAEEMITLGYDAGGLLKTLTDARSGQHTFAYDDVGHLVSDTNPAGLAKTLAREELEKGTKITLTTTAGKKWTYLNERLGTGDSRRTVTDPSGATTVALRRSDGSTRVSEPDGTTTDFSIAPDPRFGMQAPIAVREERTTPGARKRVTTRSRTVNLDGPTVLDGQTDSISVNGRTWQRTWDLATRTLTSRSPANRRATTVLDDQGRTVQTTPAEGKTPIVTEWAGNGQVGKVTQGARSWTYGYDARGRVVSRTDATGSAVSFAYDAADRVTSYTTDGGKTWSYGYDGNGNASAITTANGDAYAMTAAADDLPEDLSLPGGGGYSRSYSADRLLTQRELPSGVSELSGYDSGDRLTSLATPETTSGFSYEGATERLDVATWNRSGGSSEQTVATDYDGGLPTSVTFAGRAAGSFSYTPDNDHQVAAWGVTVGSDTRNYALSRDSDRLLTKEGPWNITRDAESGEPRAYDDGQTRVAEHHDGTGVLDQRVVTQSTTERYRIEIERDASGQVSEKRETVDGALRTTRFTYDDDDRLATVTKKDAGDADFVPVATYSYDAAGNRTDGAAMYDAQDRIEQRGGTAYTFDADGFLATRNADTFSYGRRGELLSALVAGQTVGYDYDAMGRRVRRTQGAESTQYLYGNPQDVFQVTATVDAAGALSTYFYDEEGGLRAIERGGKRYAVGADQVGSPRVVVDPADGSIVKRVDYDAWGAVSAQDGSFDLPIGFAGGIADPTTGLVRFGMRDYDTAAGRWTARDPALFAGSPMNLYAYVANDPQSLRDPSGLVCIGLSAYIVVGGGFSLCADGNGIGACAEGGLGLGAGAEIDAVEGPQNSDTTVIEATVSVGVASATIGTEFDDCGNAQTKVTAGAAGVEVGMSTSVDPQGKVSRKPALKGGIGVPLPISGKIAKKSCRSVSF
jgi:RHS repeat-associated protein